SFRCQPGRAGNSCAKSRTREIHSISVFDRRKILRRVEIAQGNRGCRSERSAARLEDPRQRCRDILRRIHGRRQWKKRQRKRDRYLHVFRSRGKEVRKEEGRGGNLRRESPAHEPRRINT